MKHDNQAHRFCQSCGMPFTDELSGTNADGSKSEDYCLYCLKDGAFTADFTMEEMAEYCSAYVGEYNAHTGQQLSQSEYKQVLLSFFPTLKRWNLPPHALPLAHHPLKQQFIDEVNALGLPELHIDNLIVLQGSFINQPYLLNGNTVKLFDDAAAYWCYQVQKSDGRCYGIACYERYIVVSEYGPNGADAEIVVVKRR